MFIPFCLKITYIYFVNAPQSNYPLHIFPKKKPDLRKSGFFSMFFILGLSCSA